MTVDRVFDRVFIECCFQIFKPVIELSYIAIISKSDDVGGVKLDASLAWYWLRTHRISFAVIIKWQCVENRRHKHEKRIRIIEDIFLSIIISVNQFECILILFHLISKSGLVNIKQSFRSMIVTELIICIDQHKTDIKWWIALRIISSWNHTCISRSSGILSRRVWSIVSHCKCNIWCLTILFEEGFNSCNESSLWLQMFSRIDM